MMATNLHIHGIILDLGVSNKTDEAILESIVQNFPVFRFWKESAPDSLVRKGKKVYGRINEIIRKRQEVKKDFLRAPFEVLMTEPLRADAATQLTVKVGERDESCEGTASIASSSTERRDIPVPFLVDQGTQLNRCLQIPPGRRY